MVSEASGHRKQHFNTFRIIFWSNINFKCEKVSELRFLATPNQQFLDSVQELDSISRQFFQLAFETNAQIRHLRIVKPSLEDIFHQQLSVSHLS